MAQLKTSQIGDLVQLEDGSWWKVVTKTTVERRCRLLLRNARDGRAKVLLGDAEVVATSWFKRREIYYPSPSALPAPRL